MGEVTDSILIAQHGGMLYNGNYGGFPNYTRRKSLVDFRLGKD
jgi:hypothetical protein